MTERERSTLQETLQDFADTERAVNAAAELQRRAKAEDIPWLLTLLKHSSIFVREAAAWPLSDLGATMALPELLKALRRGLDEGHDNNGMNAAVADMVQSNPREAEAVLKDVVVSGPADLREGALWLLEFCE